VHVKYVPYRITLVIGRCHAHCPTQTEDFVLLVVLLFYFLFFSDRQSECLMANDTYVPITICIYLSGCVLASAWPADFDLINVTLTNFGRNTAQPKRFWPDGGVGQVAGHWGKRGVPVITIIKAISFSGYSYGPGSNISEKRIRAAPIWSNNSCHII